jgi:two-component system chemotaxis sensor kinase CheA
VYSINQQEVIRIREEVQPLVRLDKSLGLPDVAEDLENRNVVVVGHGVQRVGLVVDELLGQQEIVIKSLGEYLGNIAGIAGSTILGDGRVIMIIDIAELIETIYKNAFSTSQVLT